MAVARVTEVLASSPVGWTEAVQEALARARKTLRGITGLEVAWMKAKVVDGKITEYRVSVNITFILED
jgi:dodecin